MNKPIVYFSYLDFAIEVGSIAHGYALNHQKLCTQRVTTSNVIEVKKDGNIPAGTAELETLNTRYVHIAMPEENVEIAPSPNVLITADEVDW